MFRFKKFAFIVTVLIGVVSLNSCDDVEDDNDTTTTTTSTTSGGTVEDGLTFTGLGTITVNMDHVFGNTPLALAPVSYVTGANDTIRITELTYYITDITLTTKAGQKLNLGNASLISFLPPNPSTFSIDSIPAGVYTSISYNIGVDSIRNSSGLQQGDLDPSNGMFWTWPTGYVFVRCKGRFAYNETSFSLDIGGTQNLMSTQHSLLSFKKSGTSALIDLSMNMATFFNSPNGYDLKTDPKDIHNAGSPGIVKLRPNVASSFTLKNLH